MMSLRHLSPSRPSNSYRNIQPYFIQQSILTGPHHCILQVDRRVHRDHPDPEHHPLRGGQAPLRPHPLLLQVRHPRALLHDSQLLRQHPRLLRGVDRFPGTRLITRMPERGHVTCERVPWGVYCALSTS